MQKVWPRMDYHGRIRLESRSSLAGELLPFEASGATCEPQHESRAQPRSIDITEPSPFFDMLTSPEHLERQLVGDCVRGRSGRDQVAEWTEPADLGLGHRIRRG